MFGDDWLSKSQDEHDAALNNFQAAKSGTDDAVKQVQYLLRSVGFGFGSLGFFWIPEHDFLEQNFEACRASNLAFTAEGVPSKSDVKCWIDKMNEAAKVLHERAFIIMKAQTTGWAFASSEFSSP